MDLVLSKLNNTFQFKNLYWKLEKNIMIRIIVIDTQFLIAI